MRLFMRLNGIVQHSPRFLYQLKQYSVFCEKPTFLNDLDMEIINSKLIFGGDVLPTAASHCELLQHLNNFEL